MLINLIQVLIIVVVFIVGAGCSRISPELSFGDLSLSSESLTIQSTHQVINASTKMSPVTFFGVCETNLNIVLKSKKEKHFKCIDRKYSIDLFENDFDEGVNTVSVEAYDDSKHKMDSRDVQIFIDTIPPDVSLVAPGTVDASISNLTISGTCSEEQGDVTINESVFSEENTVRCENGNWSYQYNISSKTSATEFKFSASHWDRAKNKKVTGTETVTRTVLSNFSIRGISTAGDVLASYASVLGSLSGNITVGWTESVGASKYDLSIKRVNSRNPLSTTPVCGFSDISSTSYTFASTSQCGGMAAGDQMIAEVKAWDVNHVTSVTQAFDFQVKQAPTIQSDAQILYINSDWEDTPVSTSILYSKIVFDPNSTGPFSLSITDSGGLGSQITALNGAQEQKLRINPSKYSSGVFTVKIKISDQNGLQSEEKAIKIAIVYPFSWTGKISNDFNNKSNWCGVADLKSGCPGSTINMSSGARVMIDNLCHHIAQGGRCQPELSANTVVNSFYMKSESFQQNTYSLTSGLGAGNSDFFIMDGGVFNPSAASGDLTLFVKLHILGGTFNAPALSNIYINTLHSSNGADFFKVSTGAVYVHNESTLHLIDGQGAAWFQNLALPTDLRLYNFTINSSGGNWIVNSNNLIVEGNLNLKGSKHSGIYPPFLNGPSTGKITLKGNINCDGEFGGGSLSIHMVRSTKYKSTVAGCKFPFIKIAAAGINVSEDSSSTENIVLQGLEILDGIFVAPSQPRVMTFKTLDLPDSSLVVDLSTGFDHNFGTVNFQTGDDLKNYKIKLGTMYNLAFSNPDSKSSFYDLQNNPISAYLGLLGTTPIPLRGAAKNISTKQFQFETGILKDANRLNKITILAGGPQDSYVTTSTSINVPNIEINQNLNLSGSSSVYNFSGTQFFINSFNLHVSEANAVFKYYSKSGSGTITSAGGSIIPGE